MHKNTIGNQYQLKCVNSLSIGIGNLLFHESERRRILNKTVQATHLMLLLGKLVKTDITSVADFY